MLGILGNDQLLSHLLSSIKEDRVAGCYILEGAEGTGKHTIARIVAATFMCTSPKEDGSPCLSCPQCRNVLEGGHVDVIELEPEEDAKYIPVSAVRKMLEGTHLLPTQGDWRVFIIGHAEALRKDSQNTLLKSIEEPRPKTVFLLLTEDLTKLLPTVRSRAVKLRTEPLPREVIRDALRKEGADGELLEEAVLFSSGSLGKAKALLADKNLHETREKVLLYFKALMDGAGFTKLCLILPPAYLDRSDLSRILPMMKLALRDLMCAKFGQKHAEFFSDSRFLKDLSDIISPIAAMELFEMTQDLEKALEQNINVFSALSGFHLKAQKLTR